MKRTNLVLDEQLLEQATRFSGERTYSRTVERALRNSCGAPRPAGSSIWPARASGKANSRRCAKTAASIDSAAARCCSLTLPSGSRCSASRRASVSRRRRLRRRRDLPPGRAGSAAGFRDEQAFQWRATPCSPCPWWSRRSRRTCSTRRSISTEAARRAGLTVRSSVDCLIAACAIRHSLTVLHHDRDFDLLAKVSALGASGSDLTPAWPTPGAIGRVLRHRHP